MLRVALRFLLPLVLVLLAFQFALLPVTERLFRNWAVRDLDFRLRLVSNTLHGPLIDLAEHGSQQQFQDLFARVKRDERIYAIGYCNAAGVLTQTSPGFPTDIPCATTLSPESASGQVVHQGNRWLHVGWIPLLRRDRYWGQMMLIQDMNYLQQRVASIHRYILFFFLFLGVVILTTTMTNVYWTWRGWLRRIRDVEGRAVQEENAKKWTPSTLKDVLKKNMPGVEVIVVSNREPYIHVRENEKLRVQNPASGLVTALEPVMRACAGTWIAHGSGNGDKFAVDEFDRVFVPPPPKTPEYCLRRVWLTPEEEDGYYYGFSNEGLWPLCHIAHVRPHFRSSDWKQYVAANEKFAEAILEEAKTKSPLILIQDYHFALLPKLVRTRLPQATIVSFWHIPWPNPESFGICPWRTELLDGLLGSDILGFHTRFHCNNFLETVDRFLESRIDKETNTISFNHRLTAIRHYPISIEWPPAKNKIQKSIAECRAAVRERHGLHADLKMGIGVDRLDYTKGLEERFFSVNRLLELHPEWIEKFSFVQIAAPSRSKIEEYKRLDSHMSRVVENINSKWATPSWKPILLLKEHHEPESVFEYFRAADFCYVSSLHDGMNLVAKEFIASRDDEQGTLILSYFAGASRELPESLIVNPYNIDQCASAIKAALEMPTRDQRQRMRSMRAYVSENNIYRWAAKMLMDAADIRRKVKLMNKTKKWEPSENLPA